MTTVSPPTTLDAVAEAIRACTRCPLAASRTQAVPGEGPESAAIVLIGEAPGAEEDRQGRPFIGGAGRVLDAALLEAGIDRARVYVTNAVRCRPTRVNAAGAVLNAPPKAAAIATCRDHLLAELACLDPVVVVPLGDSALRALGVGDKITAVVGERLTLSLPTRRGERPVAVVPSYHPAAVIYDSSKRSDLVRALTRAARIADGRDEEEPFTRVTVLTDVAAIEATLAQLAATPRTEPIAFDTETSGPGPGGGLDPRVLEVLCVALSPAPGEGIVIPLRGQLPADRYTRATRLYDPRDLPWIHPPAERERVLAALRAFFAAPVPKVAHNSKFDVRALATLGITVNALVDDTLLLHALIDEGSPHTLETLRQRYTPLPRYDEWKADPALLHAQDAPYALVPTEVLWRYAAADVDVTSRALRALTPLLAQEGPAVETVYRQISLPLSEAITRIEAVGLPLDVPRLLKTHALYQEKIAAVQAELDAAAGEPVNLNRKQQVRQLLYEKLALPVVKRTANGEPSVDAEAITRLMEQHPHPVLATILRMQRLVKIRDQFLCGEDGQGGLLRWLGSDGRVRTTFNLTMRTGRLSSANPNLQNIPRTGTGLRGEALTEEETIGVAIRALFHAPPGQLLIAADYSQLELRIGAYVTGEAWLIEAFRDPSFDLHRRNASFIFGVPEAEVTPEQRSLAKRFSFATQYGGDVEAVQRATGWGEEEARQALARYRSAYPATQLAWRRAAQALAEQGWIANAFGRRRHFPLYARLLSAPRGTPQWRDDRRERAKMERQAYNHTIQSTGSDLLSLATIRLVLHDAELARMGVVCCLTLHDALYFFAPRAVAEEAAARVKATMEGIPRALFGWELPVDLHLSERWE